MAPLIPRFHLFEIDDQPWFPAFLRARVQDALLATWVNRTPGLQPASPARLAADLLERHLGLAALPAHTFIDFCAGAGGPTPTIERILNRRLAAADLPATTFVLTDLHPNPDSWSRAAAAATSSSGQRRLLYESAPIDAAAAPPSLLARHAAPPRPGHPKKHLFRLFNLAFHHFPDPLARRILADTLRTSHGFALFELQAREPRSALACLLLGLGVLLSAPYHAWRLRSWTVLFFCWVVPVLPFVLVFDGLVSSLRTRTPDEVEALMRSCGADSTGWELTSGSDMHLWPVGYLHWVIATKKDD
ncbi:hypothetical protein ACHAQA_009595 [Verticillium albo-atrum]